MVYLPHWPIPGSLGNKSINYETVFERMMPVLNKLGNPHKKLPPTIHIAGTNGKGSSLSFLAQILKCNKNKIHILSSPHIHHFNERIIVNNELIDDRFLFEILEEVRLASQESVLTFLESTTIAAFLAFSKIKADYTIIECNMGGRIDATNIIEEKLATIITPISYDHEEYLGHDIRRISLEKAMIIRPQTPLFCSAQCQEAKAIIKILANDQKIDHYYYDEDFFIEKNENNSFDFSFNDIAINNIANPSLLGDHQIINLTTILALITKNFNIDHQIIKKAITSTKFKSRLEKIDQQLTNNSNDQIWIDGAHNESGAYAISQWLKQDDNFHNFVIMGFSKNKCRPNFLKKFSDIADLFCVRVQGEPNPELSEHIHKIACDHNIKINKCEDLFSAITKISNISSNKLKRIIICGSFYLARDLKKIIKLSSFNILKN